MKRLAELSSDHSVEEGLPCTRAPERRGRPPALEKPHGGLDRAAGHGVVVVRVRGVVGDDGLRAEIRNAVLDKLYQLQMGHGVHLDVREISAIAISIPRTAKARA